MSTSTKSTSHRSSLGESSAEDLNNDNDNDMWRNEIPQSDKVTDAEQDQELSVSASKKRFFDVVDVVLRIAIVLLFL